MTIDWRPGRTIVLCSWDAEEFAMIGSTEFIEVPSSYLPYCQKVNS